MPVTVPVDYETNASGLERDLTRDVTKAGSKAGKGFGSSFSSSARRTIGGLATVGAALGVKDFLGDSLAEARESQKVGALTAQVIKTTGGAANITADQVGELAGAISTKVGVDDEAIQSGANLLLTFKNVRNEIGKGANIFDRATQAAVDLSASGFGDLSGTSKQLGKALNDPVKGISALGRAGVTFTEDQKKTIKSMVEQNNILGAQKIILKEVESQVGGSAAAQVTASDKAKVAFGNLKEEIGTALLPVVDDLANTVTKDVIPAVSELAQEFQDGTGTGGEIRDVLEDIGDVLKDVAEFGKAAFDLFNSLPGPVKKLAVEGLLAYAALRKIQAISGPLATGLSGVVTRGVAATTTIDGVGRAANRAGAGVRNLAGAGGLILLAQSAQESNTALGLLEGAAGGAVAGFAVGGPWGAAIGAAGGAVLSLAGNTKDAARQTDLAGAIAAQQVPEYASYTSALEGANDALREQLRVTAQVNLEKTGALDAARALGISTKDVVSASLGNAKAIDRVNAALRDAFKSGSAINATKVQAGIGANTALLKKQTIEVNEAKLAQGKYNEVLKDVPKKAQTEIDQLGLEKAERDIIRLTDKYNLTPNQVETVLKASGTKKTDAEIQRIIDAVYRIPTERQVDIFVKATFNDAKFRSLDGRATGGPVRRGVPYIVGERRPEVFVPNESGRIIPKVPTGTAGDESPKIVINQNYFGPTTSRERNREAVWALDYGTRARV